MMKGIVILIIVCVFISSASAAYCTGSPLSYNGLPCASTTRYTQASMGSCGCGFYNGNTSAYTWQYTLYTAAGSQLLFDSASPSTSWCGPGCGACYEITPTGDCPTGGTCATKTAPIVVMVTNLCPNTGNTQWCAAVGGVDAYGYSAHFDMLDEYNTISTGLGWDNPAVTYQQVPCGTLGSPTCAQAATCECTPNPTSCPTSSGTTSAATTAKATTAAATTAKATTAATTATTAATTAAATTAKATTAATTATTAAATTAKVTTAAATTAKVTTAAATTGKAATTGTTTTTGGTGVCANSNITVYVNSVLSPFSDWSYNTHSLTATSPVHSTPDSISSTLGNYDALYFACTACINPATAAGLSFWVNGGTTSAPKINLDLIRFTSGSTGGTSTITGTTTDVGSILSGYTSVPAGVWAQGYLSFASFPSGTYDGFWFQSNSGTSQGVVYFDDITVVGKC